MTGAEKNDENDKEIIDDSMNDENMRNDVETGLQGSLEKKLEMNAEDVQSMEQESIEKQNNDQFENIDGKNYDDGDDHDGDDNDGDGGDGDGGDGDDDDDDGAGWITPGNISKVKKEMGFEELDETAIDAKNACLTTDFAMQVHDIYMAIVFLKLHSLC